MNSITAYLPPHEGLLPKWLLLLSTISVLNSVQAYSTTSYTKRVYNGLNPLPSKAPAAVPSKTLRTPSTTSPETPTPVTPLQARTFGTWTLLSAIVRLYGAYYIDQKVVYELTFWTYAIAFLHFSLEWLGFGTANLKGPLKGPVAISTGTLIWMWLQYDFYVNN